MLYVFQQYTTQQLKKDIWSHNELQLARFYFIRCIQKVFFPFLSLPTGSESNTDPENQVEANEKRYSYRFSFFFFQEYKTCFVAKGLMY